MDFHPAFDVVISSSMVKMLYGCADGIVLICLSNFEKLHK